MSYWIFVIGGIDANDIFQHLLKLKNWGFWKSRPVRKNIESLKKEDVIVFYIGGPRGKYLAGEAKLTSGICKPNRASLNLPERGPLDGIVYFNNVDLWHNRRLYLTEVVRQDLRFIKNKQRWGIAFRQQIKPITERDYNDIKRLLGNS